MKSFKPPQVNERVLGLACAESVVTAKTTAVQNDNAAMCFVLVFKNELAVVFMEISRGYAERLTHHTKRIGQSRDQMHTGIGQK